MVLNAHGSMRSEFTNDVAGDPTAFFESLKMGSRVYTCDQLLILDCAYAGKAFPHQALGRRKFEILASTAPYQRHQSYEFTKQLSECMQRLLKSNAEGFSTSELNSELAHRKSVDKVAGALYESGPLHFVETAHDFGRIWLRPQRLQTKTQTLKSRVFMNVTFALDEYPDDEATNEIARALRHLPHVNQFRLEKIYDPKATLTSVVKLVMWMKRWCKKGRTRSYAARQLRKWSNPADIQAMRRERERRGR